MFDYLQQFNNLSQELRNKVSSETVMVNLTELEKKYQVDLAMIVMKVMIKSLAIKNLPSVFISEFNLSPDKAKELTRDMKDKIFFSVADYVGISSQIENLNLEDNIELLIKESGITLANSDLIERFKRVLYTYLKGIRNRIDTRQTLAKEVNNGGLGLSQIEIDRVFKVCDIKNYQAKAPSSPPPASSSLEKIINQDKEQLEKKDVLLKANYQADNYDLKKALASGETKKASEREKKEESIDNVQAELEKELQNLEKEEKEKKEAGFKKEDKEKEEEKEGISPPLIVKKPEKHGFFNKQKQIKKEEGEEKEEKEKREEKEKSFTPQSGAIKLGQVAQIEGLEKKIDKNQEEEVKKEEKLLTPKTVEDQEIKKVSISRPVAKTVSKKRRLDDVKVVPKVMGPLEELQFLDLTNFRRLGKTPEEITTKIFNKIKLLEIEGYDKMIAAISAWKKSPVNRLYLKIMQKAIASGKSIQEYINSNLESEEKLTWEEIKAIINLNSRLTF